MQPGSRQGEIAVLILPHSKNYNFSISKTGNLKYGGSFSSFININRLRQIEPDTAEYAIINWIFNNFEFD